MIGRTCKQHSHAKSSAQDDAGEATAYLYPRYPEVLKVDSTWVPEGLMCMDALPKTALSSCGTTLPIVS